MKLNADQMIALVNQLQVADVASVYSGKNGRCCCGCSGKYSYNPAWSDFSSESRGYALHQDEFNVTMVKKVLRLLKENVLNGEVELLSDADQPMQFTLELGERLYMVMCGKPIPAHLVLTDELDAKVLEQLNDVEFGYVFQVPEGLMQ
jgi:hypothetical protein